MENHSANILVNDELIESNKKHGDFNSAHEGYSVLLEEYEELQDENLALKKCIDLMWKGIKKDDNHLTIGCLEEMESLSGHLIEEAIQVAAMVRKLHLHLKANG